MPKIHYLRRIVVKATVTTVVVMNTAETFRPKRGIKRDSTN
jgi:hypothetical protein